MRADGYVMVTPVIHYDAADIYCGDNIDILCQLPSESVNCCITSPPYYGLRDYGTAEWEGGDENCDHISGISYNNTKSDTFHGGKKEAIEYYKDICKKCGAVRIDNQIGLEKTPEEYVSKMVDVFREIHRVLRADGTVWLNIGDSYTASSNTGGTKSIQGTPKRIGAMTNKGHLIPLGLKPKDIIGIPWQVAFALQADGWYLRQDIIWHKPNPMPEPVTDRCTKAHEYIFLLSKSKRYWYDNKAIAEKSVCFETDKRAKNGRTPHKSGKSTMENSQYAINGVGYAIDGTRNKRSVWTIPTKPYKEAHFAVFPEELIIPCVRAGCPIDGTVLDPFTGSGTTGFVALKNGRKFIGIELNPEYLPLINKRIGAVATQMRLDL